MATSLNPECLPEANNIAHINADNFSVYRDTIRQGVIEGRLWLRALVTIHISLSAWDTCKGSTLPSGTSEIRFSEKRTTAMG